MTPPKRTIQKSDSVAVRASNPLQVIARSVGQRVGVWVLVFRLCSSAIAVMPPEHASLPDVDKRAAAAAPSPEREQGRALLNFRLSSAQVEFDPLLGSPKFIRANDGFLTGAKGEGRAVSRAVAQGVEVNDSHRAVKTFLNEHSALFGHGAEVIADAKVHRESVGAHNGLRTVVWQQQLDGIPVFEANIIGNITKNGELAAIASRFLPDPAKRADAGTPQRRAVQSHPPVSAAQAIANAHENAGDPVPLSEISPAWKLAAGGEFLPFKAKKNNAHARLVWLPMDRATLRLAWEVFITTAPLRESYQTLVDAVTGEILVRRALNRYISNATYNVFTSDSPSPFSPGHQTPSTIQPPLTNRVFITTSALSAIASPNGWINDGDNETFGNNVDARLDRNFDGQPDGPRPRGNPTRVFDFPLDLAQDPASYADAAVVNLFYWLNVHHDRLYELGFTEAMGNFQADNFGRGGLGGDAIEANAQSGGNFAFIRNNAFFSPAPDGIPPQIAMFLFDGPSPQRDGDLDADVFLHEAAHGTSERLVGGGAGISALQSWGMGEGWSDFYALSLLSGPDDDPDACHAMGGYVTLNFFGLAENYYFGIRHFPYSIDLNKNPFTFKDIDPAQISPHAGVPRSPVYSPFDPGEADEVHHQGEVWCVALWEARANLIAKHGGAAGNQLMLQLVTDGMKLCPANPNFLQARDAIILADRVNNGGANFLELWRGFAKRGMGFSATSPDSFTTVGVREAFDLPGLTVDRVATSGDNGNGVIDPDECNDLQIFLLNGGAVPAGGISARLSTATPGVVIAQSVSGYADISVGATNVNLVPFKVGTAPGFVCGTPVDFTLVINSDRETRTNQFRLTTGIAGAPVRFDNNTPVAIPDNNAVGASSLVEVSNIASAIGKVTVSLYLTHTFDADLKLQLISPDGKAVTLSSTLGGAGDNFGGDCEMDGSRATFDDDAVGSIGAGSPPFIGTFKPVEPLSAFIGKSGAEVNGAWQLHVVDQFAIDVGVIQCWSLFLSPAVCAGGGGRCPDVDLAVGITANPDPAFVGTMLTYTITVTNNGAATASDIFVTNIFPASVKVVSKISSQGTFFNSGGLSRRSLSEADVVVANLGALAGGAHATITVRAVATLEGTMSAGANAVSREADLLPASNAAAVSTTIRSRHPHPPRQGPPSLSGLARTPDGLRLTLDGLPGSTYVIETATHFPATVWTPVCTNTTTADGAFGFTDTAPADSAARFYRARLVP